MTTKTEMELFAELRMNIQEIRIDNFEANRMEIIALVDELRALAFSRYSGPGIGTTLKAVESAFLRGLEQTLQDEPIPLISSSTREETNQQLASRQNEQLQDHAERFKNLSAQVTPLHSGAVLSLFSNLEFISGSVIRALLALIRTVKPAKIKEQCPWLPDSLITAAQRALKAEKLKAGHTKTKPGKIAVHAEWLAKGFHERRAKRGELIQFSTAMAEKYHCAASTISKRWIPEWSKELKAKRITTDVVGG